MMRYNLRNIPDRSDIFFASGVFLVTQIAVAIFSWFSLSISQREAWMLCFDGFFIILTSLGMYFHLRYLDEHLEKAERDYRQAVLDGKLLPPTPTVDAK